MGIPSFPVMLPKVLFCYHGHSSVHFYEGFETYSKNISARLSFEYRTGKSYRGTPSPSTAMLFSKLLPLSILSTGYIY